MAKYIKYFLVDNDTGEFLGKGVMGQNGLRHPFVKGLDLIVMDDQGQCFSKIDDDAQIPLVGNIQQTNLDEINQIFQTMFQATKTRILNHLWQIASEKRQQFVKDYHMSELVAGATYKISEAKQCLADPENASTVAPNLYKEAQARGINLNILATKVIEKYDLLVDQESKIAGYAGKLADIVKNSEFVNNPAESNQQLKTDLKTADLENWLPAGLI